MWRNSEERGRTHKEEEERGGKGGRKREEAGKGISIKLIVREEIKVLTGEVMA